MFPPLEEWTESTWFDAKTALNSNAFKQYIKIAKAGGISIPSTILLQGSPRISFVSISDIAQYQRMKDVESVNKFNADVLAWGKKVESELKQSVETRFSHRLSKQVTAEFPRLSDSIQLNVRFDKQYKMETRSVGFKFERHGVYQHYGAGRGYGGKTGSKWTDKYSKTISANPDSVGKMGTGNRTAVHWFNDIIRNNMEELTDIVANYSLDILVNANSIMLPE